MTEPRTIEACRVCENTELRPVLSLGRQYLTGVFPQDPSEPLTCGPLELCKCETRNGGCGLVQLRHSYSSTEMYGDNYGYRSSLNASMVQHLQEVVAHLLGVVELAEGDFVVDIGSNDGTTLSFYPDTLNRVGIDPTASKFASRYKPGIHIEPDFFSAHSFDTRFGGAKARIVTSIAMLYDLERPVDFARQVASIMHDEGIWHFEQSYLPSMVATTGYDTICHEHVEYYGLVQIERVIQAAGLRILETSLNDVNGGSFSVTVCKQDSRLVADDIGIRRMLRDEIAGGFDSIDPLIAFRDRVEEHRETLTDCIEGLNREGALVLGYGASTKGNVILQYCGIGPESIPAIAEVNEEKFGRFTPGTGIRIISEEDAHSMRPDYFLVMPWHFRENLLRRETKFLAAGGGMIFPLPSVDITRG